MKSPNLVTRDHPSYAVRRFVEPVRSAEGRRVLIQTGYWVRAAPRAAHAD